MSSCRDSLFAVNGRRLTTNRMAKRRGNMTSTGSVKLRFNAVDLFCGAGGLTCGFVRAGIRVVVGVDNDPTCRFPFEQNNPGARFVHRDVSELCGQEVASWFPEGTIRILAGCAPCQPFSQYSIREGDDNRWQLLSHFLGLVGEVQPDIISMENVPALKAKNHPAYRSFIFGLNELRYHISDIVVRCRDYGVPQTRDRLVLLASLKTPIAMVPPTSPSAPTVRSAIGGLPPITAGGESASGRDPLHVASGLSPRNLERIRATPEGGSWRNWPKRLQLECHRRETGKWYGSVYGRMAWDEPAPTITTQCYGYGNGRFGHPEQERAISLREAALLQTFPSDYQFVPPGEIPRFLHVGRHIGNAVPVALAEAIGASIMQCYAA